MEITGSGMRDRKCGTGDGADVHDAPGSGTFRYGIFFYGSVYGLPGGGIDRGQGTRVIMEKKLEMRRGSVIRIRRGSSIWKYQY